MAGLGITNPALPIWLKQSFPSSDSGKALTGDITADLPRKFSVCHSVNTIYLDYTRLYIQRVMIPEG